MSRVNWSNYLPMYAKVLHSSLCIPSDCDAFERDVVAIELPGGYGIDVEWRDDDQHFMVTLYRGRFENEIFARYVDSPAAVIAVVKSAVDHATGTSTADYGQQQFKWQSNAGNSVKARDCVLVS